MMLLEPEQMEKQQDPVRTAVKLRADGPAQMAA